MFGFFKKKNDVVTVVSKDTPSEPKKQQPKKFKLDENYEDFTSVDGFDTNQYINETFQDIFHSIMNDDDWGSVINDVEIYYKKKNIDIKIDYEDYRNFKIKSIWLYVKNKHSYSASEIFQYTESLDATFYKFVYDFYSSSKEKENNEKKQKFDNILTVVKDAIGKSSIRDRRLDELLG